MKSAAKIPVLCIALSLILLGSATKGEAEAAVGMTLEALVEAAMEKNPELQAARDRWQMFERKITPAGDLDDPRLTLSLVNYPVDSFRDDQTPMTGKVVKLSQAFPFPGKRGAKKEVAAQQALWYQAVYEDTRLQVIRQVKDAWYALYFQEKAVQVTERNLALLDDFIRLTETRYAVGKGLQQDVLRAQLERSRLTERLLTIRQQTETARANLSRLVDGLDETGMETLGEVSRHELGTTEDELLSGVERKRPLLTAYRSLVDQYQAKRKLARLDYWPDFTLGAGYTLREENRGDDGTDFVGLEFGMNLPLRRAKRGEQVAEADSGIRMALQQYRDTLNQVRFNIQDAYAQLEKNRQLTSLYQTGIIPQAEQSYRAALSGYQVDKVDFLTLLDNLMTLFRYQLDYYRALSDSQRSLARLEAETGQALRTPRP